MFRVAEAVILFCFLYFSANLFRYMFFKDKAGHPGIFGLSDYWLKKDEVKKKK